MTVLLVAILAGMAVFTALGGFADLVMWHRVTDGTAPVGARRVRRRAASGWPEATAWWPPARRAARDQRRAAVIELCAAMVAELRAGRLPVEALLRAAQEVPSGTSRPSVAPHAVSAARSGLDLVAALRADAAAPGAEGLRGLVACLQVSGDTGAGLALAVARLVAALRAEQERRRRIAAELAAPQATARLLAALPILGLALGHAMGADPLRVLTGTGWGRLVVVVGIALDGAGFLWVRALAARAERAGSGEMPWR